MQVTSGSRDYLPVGSARVRFADPLPAPIQFQYVPGSRISGPVCNIASGRQGNSGIGIVKSLPTTPRASGHHKVAHLEMTIGSSCLCHRGVQNELMDGET